MEDKSQRAIPSDPTLDDLTNVVRRIGELAAEVVERSGSDSPQPTTDNRKALIERQRIELLAVNVSEIRSLANDAERAIAELLLLRRGLTLNQTAALTRFSAASLSSIRAQPQYFDSAAGSASDDS